MKKKVAFILIVVMMFVSVTACSFAGITHAVDGSTKEVIKGETSAEDNYNWDTSRTYAVAVVKYIDEPDGYAYEGSGVEGFPSEGHKSWAFECEVLYFYNYYRLRDTAESCDPEALYHYFSVGRRPRYLSKNIIEDAYLRDTEIFTGGNISEKEYLSYFSEYALEHFNNELTYVFHMDWEYRKEISVGDVLLLAVDPQLNINPNEGYDTKWFHVVVSPFAESSPKPFVAWFVDGKLQLPEELKDPLNLRRLYDDTEPERTSIKDGDSVDDVIAFIKCVEQDVERYQESIIGR